MSYQLLRLPKEVPISAGTIVPGARVRLYITNTSTPAPGYSDSDLSTAYTQPIEADAAGVLPVVYLDPTITYRATVSTAADVLLYTVDDINDKTLSQSLIGEYLYPLSTDEQSNGLADSDIEDFSKPHGDIRRYGTGLTSGSVDASAAFISAQLSGHKILGGGPENTYRIDSTIALTQSLDFDGQGCTIRPNGNTPVFVRNSVTPTASTTISSGATIGSRSFVVASATGIVVGQWVRVYSNDEPTNDLNVFPSHWAKVTSIASTTIEIDSPFEITQQGTITAEFLNTALIYPGLKVKNVIFDGSASTYDTGTGQAIRAFGFENVDVDCEFINWDNAESLTCPLELAQNVDVRARVRVVDGVSEFHVIDIQDSRTATLVDSICEGSHFGMTITRCESALMMGNTVRGRYRMEQQESTPGVSVRGLKMYGCGTARMLQNYCADYESPIKVECCHQFDISHNTVRNAGLGNTSSIALNIGNQVDGDITTNGIVSSNIVINCGGTAIGVTSGTTATTEGRCIITGNQVKTSGAGGIRCLAPNSIVSNNRVEDWGTSAATTYAAIYVNDGGTLIGNRFRHSLEATSWCITIASTAVQKYTIRDNTCESNNPVFWNGSAEVFVDNRGQSSIASGSTSRTITHLLLTTPEVTDIYITPTNNPTNDPGNFYVDTITSTQFTVRVRSDPGASTATFGYRAALKMPFSANLDMP